MIHEPPQFTAGIVIGIKINVHFFDTLSCKCSIAEADPSQGVPDVSRNTWLCKECKMCKMVPEKKKPVSLPSAIHAK